jgi:hypothetical protein
VVVVADFLEKEEEYPHPKLAMDLSALSHSSFFERCRPGTLFFLPFLLEKHRQPLQLFCDQLWVRKTKGGQKTAIKTTVHFNQHLSAMDFDLIELKQAHASLRIGAMFPPKGGSIQVSRASLVLIENCIFERGRLVFFCVPYRLAEAPGPWSGILWPYQGP